MYPEKDAIEDVEIELLLEGVYQRYGYDFRDYARTHVRRRILNRLQLSQLESISQLQHHVLYDPDFASLLIKDLSISVTEMFRDPAFYRAVRDKIIPALKTWSYVKIWHAGCSTGEEVYSMAILLKEEGLYDRVQIYATDFNEYSLKQAREGIFSLEDMKQYSGNYQQSNARHSFSNYYFSDFGLAIMDQSLKKNIVWANHNLVTDSDFTETHMIVCRNVLIYFNRGLQNKVYKLFYSSLVNGGILCLGSRENLYTSDFKNNFDVIDQDQKIYKKKYISGA
ncbi:Chemotaxis protein methyltransferase CheR [Fulvivirga imtechensis AK7]|uniref:Chemotaxis protein methyltransferase CheR n=1 Tax=Fulvivirga imtechensis AK7 TaxID=1237149 RepID=L8K375_9BACT|nr:protein-glutamate O-methyltransferase CheR [Fulvivirga imtechensis]ELR73922.1 Chemotaxis protein methyltransferase CheR [Fulvivirga imtechensis AK7]